MVSSPPRARARRVAQSETTAPPQAAVAPVPAARIKKSAVPSGAQIAAALLDRSQSPHPAKSSVDAPSCVPTASKLRVDKKVCGSNTTLYLIGALSTLTLAQVRDEAFTAIGARPPYLCLDLTGAENPDAAALDSLVTIASVARMMGVTFCIRASAPLMGLLETSHLSRLIPVDQVDDAPLSSHLEWLQSASR